MAGPSTEAVARSRAKAVPRCRCGETEPSAFYPSMPYACRACMREYQKWRRQRGY